MTKGEGSRKAWGCGGQTDKPRYVSRREETEIEMVERHIRVGEALLARQRKVIKKPLRQRITDGDGLHSPAEFRTNTV